MKRDWEHWFPDIPLEVRPSPYRSVVGPLLDFLDETDEKHNDGQVAAVVLPEFVPGPRWYQVMLHNQSAWLLEAALLYRRRQLGFQRAIIDVPYHLRR